MSSPPKSDLEGNALYVNKGLTVHRFFVINSLPEVLPPYIYYTIFTHKSKVNQQRKANKYSNLLLTDEHLFDIMTLQIEYVFMSEW